MVHPAVTVRPNGDIRVCCGPDACITVKQSRRRQAEPREEPNRIVQTVIVPTVIEPTMLRHSEVVDHFDAQVLANLSVESPLGGGNLAVHASPGESIRLDAMNALAEQSGRSIDVEVH